MGQIDFGKIISAAAVSTLGVLSLIVVALGVIAFFFFKGSPDKVKLTVWMTMLVAGGLFAVAFITQADRTGAGEPTPDPAKTAEPVVPIASASTPAPPVATSTAETSRVKDADPSDLTGRWHDGDGFLYDVTAYGTVFMYQQYQNGANVGSGQGSLSGKTLRYGFLSKSDGGQGQCDAIVAADYRSISGKCASGGESWPFFIER